MLEDLPPDALDLVVAHLGAADRARLGATSTYMRDRVSTVCPPPDPFLMALEMVHRIDALSAYKRSKLYGLRANAKSRAVHSTREFLDGRISVARHWGRGLQLVLRPGDDAGDADADADAGDADAGDAPPPPPPSMVAFWVDRPGSGSHLRLYLGRQKLDLPNGRIDTRHTLLSISKRKRRWGWLAFANEIRPARLAGFLEMRTLLHTSGIDFDIYDVAYLAPRVEAAVRRHRESLRAP